MSVKPACAPAQELSPAVVTWEVVEESAITIRNLRGEINSQEKNIAIGGVFKELRTPLLKHSRHDKSAPGWVSIFTGPEGQRRFGCDRRHAEKHILVHDAFAPHVGRMYPTCDLPSGFRPLALLARLALDERFPPPLLAKYLDNGRIHSNSTEQDIRKIGLGLGILESKSRVTEEPVEQPAQNPISELRARMDDAGLDAVLEAMPLQMRSQLRLRLQEENNRGRVRQEATEAEAKVIRKAKVAIANRNAASAKRRAA
jgi:hypothetical protein